MIQHKFEFSGKVAAIRMVMSIPGKCSKLYPIVKPLQQSIL